MKENTKHYQNTNQFGKIVMDDLSNNDFFSSIRKDWDELKEYFLDNNSKTKLEKMDWIKRHFYMLWWMLRSLYLKLTQPRRVLLIFSMVFFLLSFTISTRGHIANDYGIIKIYSITIVLLLFLLMLELKDKLIAKEELETGEKVQTYMQSERNPIVDGWSICLYSKSAHEVGGDMVDFININNERFGIAVADISGKGLGASLLMIKLQATLRALAPNFDSLSSICTKINEIFYRDTMPKSFASMVYTEIYPKSNVVNYINAGHLPPIVIKKNSIEKLEKGSIALGLMKNANYDEKTIELNSNETLIIYSDGITEAKDVFSDFFSEKRLLKIIEKNKNLSVDSLCDKIIQSVSYFIGNEKPYDDISIAIIRKN